MAGRITPTTFNGNNIQSATYDSRFLRDSGIGDIFESSQVTAGISGDFASLIRMQPEGRALSMRVTVTALSAANVHTLKQWFNSRTGPQILKATDELGNTLRLVAAPLRMESAAGGFPGLYDVWFWVPRPVWEKDSLSDQTQTCDADPEQWTIGNNGNDTSEPRTTITVATTASAYKAAVDSPAYQRHAALANRSLLSLVDANGNPWPIDITGGGWDAETEIKANRVHPQGYDVTVYANGVPVNRYLANWGAGMGAGDGDGTPAFRTFHNGALAWHAHRFRMPGCTNQETNTVDEIRLWLKKVGAPGGTVRCKIYTEVNGLPGSLVTNGTTNTVAASGITTSFVETSLTFAVNPVLNANTFYWLLIDPSGLTGQSDSIYVKAADYTNEANVAGTLGYEGLVVTAAHAPDSASNPGTWVSFLALTNGHGVLDFQRGMAFRVFVSGTAKVWVPLALAPQPSLTLASSMTDSTGSVIIAELEGYTRLPDRCAVIIGTECIIVRKNMNEPGTMSVLKRGARGTTAVEHVIGAPVYMADTDIRLICGWNDPNDLGKTIYEPEGLAPVIDGRVSTNESMKWIGPYFAFENETRPGAWRHEQDDTVDLADQVSLDGSVTNDKTIVTFKDQSPAGAYLSRNTMVQQFPVGVRNAASAITLDEAAINPALAIEHLLTNGDEELVATHRSSDAGAGKTITPTDLAYRYRIRVRNETITGAEASGGADVPITSTAPKAQTFTLDNDAEIKAFAFKIKESTGTPPVNNLSIDLYAVNDDDDESVDTSVKLMPTQSVTPSDTTTSYATIVKALATTVKLSAGKYAFVFTTSEASNGYSLQGSDGSVYSGGEARTGGQVTLSVDADYDVSINADGTSISENPTTTHSVVLGATNRRAAFRFPLTSLPASASVTSAVLKVKVATTTGGPLAMDGYATPGGGSGQADPDADSGTTLYSNMTEGLEYSGGSGFTVAVGENTWVLTGSIIADLAAARAAVSRFTLCPWKISTNGTTTIYGNAHASEPAPILALTYTPANTAAYTTRLGQDMWFRVYGAPAQSDTPGGTGGTATVDNIIVNLDNVTPHTPVVVFQTAQQDCWLLNARLQNVLPTRDTGVAIAEDVDAAGETSIEVDDVTPFLGASTTKPIPIMIDGAEKMNVTGISMVLNPNVINVVRAQYGTSQNTHATGSTIKLLHQVVDLLAVMQAGETLDIDWGKRTVKHSDDDLADPFYMTALVAFDEMEPFTMAPGTNTLVYNEDGLSGTATVTVRTRFRESFL